MKKTFLLALSLAALASCKQNPSATKPGLNFTKLLDKYYEERLILFPLEATANGDNRYNDLLAMDGSAPYIKQTHAFYEKYLHEIGKVDSASLDVNDRLSYTILKGQMQEGLESEKLHFEYLPFNQFYSLPLTMGQLGSGSGMQPFKTVKDYDNWLKRVDAFSIWADTAIANFRKGIKAGVVLPKSLVVKMIPQMNDLAAGEPEQSLFFTPVKQFPNGFSDTEKQRLKEAYTKAIIEKLKPAYTRLGGFLHDEYLLESRSTSGISSVKNGSQLYRFLVRQQTTTNKTPEEIYRLGLTEVKRIKGEMEKTKAATGFKGDLSAFFEYMKTDRKFMPFKTPKEVLAAFEKIHQTMEPNLKKMFNHTPKTPFEIRQTEAFRAASASAEYNQGSADGSRPGIFYVPILDAKTFNTTSGMESLFLHEAIPGHHYQISLTQESTELAKFRRFGGNNAYVEGWALYCESLGKELGLYTDPYQYMGALGDEMHRAIRLVVDVAIHTKNMSREQAIKYMMDNEAISEQGATAEIERYMAIPAQALGYKIGALKIRELRSKYEKQMGDKFDLAEFHDQILKDGAMPLSVLEVKMDNWANKEK